MRRESAGNKIEVISQDWESFFGSISQQFLLLVVDLIGFSEEDVALLKAFYEDTSLRVRTGGVLSALKKNESFNEAEPSSSLTQDAIWAPSMAS